MARKKRKRKGKLSGKALAAWKRKHPKTRSGKFKRKR